MQQVCLRLGALFIWHQPISNLSVIVKGLNYWHSSEKSTWKLWSWVNSLFNVICKLGPEHFKVMLAGGCGLNTHLLDLLFHKVEISSLATFHNVSTESKCRLHLWALLMANAISLLLFWISLLFLVWTTSFLVSTVSWMRLTTRLPLSFCSLVYITVKLQQPSHKPQLPSIPWRGRQRLHAADCKINICHKPLKPQNYFMRKASLELH